MLHTKKDFIDCLTGIVNPVKEHYTDGKAGAVLGSTGVQYGEEIALFEGFARILWGVAPLWCGGNNRLVCLRTGKPWENTGSGTA